MTDQHLCNCPKAQAAPDCHALSYMRACQGVDGKVRPIPDDEDFAALPPRRGAAGAGAAGGDADLALAVRLQEEEIVQAAGANAAQRRER